MSEAELLKCRRAFERVLYPESWAKLCLMRRHSGAYEDSEVEAEWVTWHLAWDEALKANRRHA